MKPKYLLFAIFLLTICLGKETTLYADDPSELGEYFELRDTIVLMNDEMKKIIDGKKEQSIFNEGDPIQNLNGSMTFIEQRIDEFAEKDTQLKYHYAKKLRSLFDESAKLHGLAKAIYIKEATQKAKESKKAEDAVKAIVLTNTEKEFAKSTEPWHRPYFEPIDVRLLAAVPQRNPNAEKSYEFGKKPTINRKSDKNKTAEADKKEAKEAKSSNESKTDKQEINSLEVARTNAKEVLEKLSKKLEAIERLEPQEIPPILPADKSAKNEPQKEQINRTEEKNQSIKTKSAAVAAKTEVKPADMAQTKETETIKTIPTGLIKGEIKSPIRPLAIMVENHNAARPQTGLAEANLLYEIPVEGGITRFMGIFTKLPGAIGPIRSCREYFIDRALEAQAFYIHCGASPKGYDYISSSKINSMDEIKYGKPFYRDKSRKAPHNLYSTGRKLFDAACELCQMLMPAQPVFINRGSSKIESSQQAVSLSIRYHGDYSVEIKYGKGTYNRYMNGTLHIDRETSKPLEAVAVILQTANMKVVDKAGRQEISFIGSGDAQIFENGRVTKATWSKAGADSVTSYKTSSGEEYVFPEKGQIWVQVVSPNTKIEIKDKE